MHAYFFSGKLFIMVLWCVEEGRGQVVYFTRMSHHVKSSLSASRGPFFVHDEQQVFPNRYFRMQQQDMTFFKHSTSLLFKLLATAAAAAVVPASLVAAYRINYNLLKVKWAGEHKDGITVLCLYPT